MADLQHLFQLGQQVTGRLQQLQADLADRLIEASAGGGMVQVTVDGRGTVRAVRIDEEAFAGRDAELLADLVLSAIAEGQRRASELAQAEVRRVQGTTFPPAL